ncbi:AraC-type DNA-binding protein [Chitinophaga sp. CF118]|uniref:AraC family transcriptional regulator n=1 Tax=Chitinophaga sp. CF118 TaxID=1884367 RepID=UPI0008E24265|nr:AraC family transcriptional regulator [Chitinophaga sp. CF118]SFF03645.1 AraC-type DNA-binding protein [Chitinophaga sp. CF118]
MEVRNLHQPFELDLLEIREYDIQKHKNTFFEMVFVLGGKGVQIINDHRLPYISDQFFVIFPQDSHSFEVESFTRFFFIRFNESYLRTQDQDWVRKLEYIFHTHNHLPGCVLKTISDKPLVRALVEGLILENTNQHPQQQEVLKQLVNTIITIAARNMQLMESTHPSTGNRDEIMQILSYIHQNIYAPELLKSAVIATQFNIASSYIGEYFKSKTDQSIQQYIQNYKLKLIERRLRFTNMQMNEIVHEFGFTDASHLNRLFKKHAGLSPTEFRKSIRLV